MKNTIKRRKFIKTAVGAGLAMSMPTPWLTSCISSRFDAKGLPVSILGKTGVTVPRIALGCGSRFCAIPNEDEAQKLLITALDNGLYYWDTAHSYQDTKTGVKSEERLGRVVKDRRNEIFLVSKVDSRNPEEAKRELEQSLKFLHTDKLDVLMIHAVGSEEEVEQMGKKGQLIDFVQQMKSEGVADFIGCSGHGSARALKKIADRGDFDCIMMAMNHWGEKKGFKREELAVPAALRQNMGVMLMKAIRPKDNIPEISPESLVRYALSLEGPTGITVGMDSMEVLESNLKILRSFKPLSKEEKNRISEIIAPFFRDEGLEWMNSSYRDGFWG